MKTNNVEDQIPIDKMRDYIIVEKTKDDTILKGSKIYCGCCGKSLGELKKKLTFPFKSDVLVKALKERSFVITHLGLSHKLCGHVMFSFRKDWAFITLENYLIQTTKAIS